MASKGFENRDSKSEKAEGGKHSGGQPFNFLDLMGMPSPKDIEKNVKSTVEHAVDDLKKLVGEAEKQVQKLTSNDSHHDFPRGSLLKAAGTHQDFPKGSLLKAADTHHDFPRGSLLNDHASNHNHPLMGRLVHNETPHQNPIHKSAFLLRRLHENSNQAQQFEQQPMQFNLQATQFEQQPMQFNQQATQFEQQPMSFDQQNQQAEPQGNSWQEAKYNVKHAASEMVVDNVAKPLASMAIGAELNPNLGANENELRQMGMPFTRSIYKDKERLDRVIHGVATGHAEKFQSQIHHFQGSGPFHPYSQGHSNVGENNFYRQNQQLPRASFHSNISYYRSSS